MSVTACLQQPIPWARRIKQDAENDSRCYLALRSNVCLFCSREASATRPESSCNGGWAHLRQRSTCHDTVAAGISEETVAAERSSLVLPRSSQYRRSTCSETG